ncbi:ribosomal RNA-processing protein 8-like isoform X2 [Haliotis rufescens]|uniref:ribosomal RNA-processing protein 8-like isoform X2 n=1 Tax=Haliotis rufescens TaxID=6454 RepID=UPI00201F5091|nr:ribosomal RNA-processing protein 8-like isoform X2 [Haliotis rufescens]
MLTELSTGQSTAMFDNEDWNVDGEAAHLASSLFDPVTPTPPRNKKKKSKHSDPNLTNTSDTKSPAKRKHADETSPTPKKKKKNKDSEERNTNVTPVVAKSGKQNLHKDSDSVSKKKKKMSVSPESAGDISSEGKVKKKKKKKKQIVSHSQENVAKPDQSENSQGDKKKKLKRKKISGEKDKDDESASKKLNVQETQGRDESRVEGDTPLTRKERRHKHKKKTCKKNKYKHLADASKISDSTDGSTSSVAVASNPDVKGQFVLLKKNTDDSGETKPGQSLDRKKKKKRKKNLVVSDHPSPQVKNNKVNMNVSTLSENRTDENSEDNVFEKSAGGKKRKKKSKPESDVSGNVTKLKTPKKHSFDLEKLKEIISSDKKQYVKKLTSGNGQKEKRKSVEVTETPKKVIKKKGFTNGTSTDTSDTSSSPTKIKTPPKENFDVKKLKEIMSSEKKKMDTLKQDLEKKVNRRGRNQGKSLTDRMHERLSAARFRYLNEQMYTTTGTEAAQLFADDEEAFHVYHEGYRSQVSKWPIDPLDIIINEINARHKTPKTVIADLGCGSARLAQSISGVKVHSFDLVSVNERVTACDMSKVPLDAGCVDVAVFCLSLMGTNLVDYLLEANRILKKGGVMMIAEVESRFQKVGAFILKVEKLGFEIVNKDTSNKMFYLFHFKKVRGMKEAPLNSSIELDPCIYKKR